GNVAWLGQRVDLAACTGLRICHCRYSRRYHRAAGFLSPLPNRMGSMTMYEQVSHSLLNQILNQLPADLIQADLRHFYTRLGANFYAIHNLMKQLYGQCEDFEPRMQQLVEVMARQYILRSAELRAIDLAREQNHNWFLDQKWVGMALYSDGFAGDLKGVGEHLHYFQE